MASAVSVDILGFKVTPALALIFLLESIGSTFNSVVCWMSVEAFELPATCCLTLCNNLALFLFVGVRTRVLSFLGFTIFLRTIGWPRVLHMTICCGFEYSFLLTKCVRSLSSSLSRGSLHPFWNDSIKVLLTIFSVGPGVEVAIGTGILVTTGVDGMKSC